MSVLDNVIIKKSKRARYISIKIKHDGSLAMTVPYFTSTILAKRFLQSKSDWINQQLLKIKREQHIFTDKQAIGKTHQLNFVSHDGPYKTTVRNNVVLVSIPHGATTLDPNSQKHARTAVFRALKKEAKVYLTKRLDTHAQLNGFSYNELRFKNTATRWGSCSSAKNINLNIQLMRLPYHLIDYVILHELCHLKHQNHSKTFWLYLETLLPGARNYKKELKDYSILYRD